MLPIPILYEDDFLLAINKPSGLRSVPDPFTPIEKTVLGKVKKMYADRQIYPYLLHRLDAETSGVLLFGKDEKDRMDLENIFKLHHPIKNYTALLLGTPLGGTINTKLKARHSSATITAHTDFKVILKSRLLNRPVSLTSITISTGRKHQIRRHFAKISCPVINDKKYGDFAFNRKITKALTIGRMFLHASSITFAHPMLKREITITAVFPKELEVALGKIFGKESIKSYRLESQTADSPQKRD